MLNNSDYLKGNNDALYYYGTPNLDRTRIRARHDVASVWHLLRSKVEVDEDPDGRARPSRCPSAPVPLPFLDSSCDCMQVSVQIIGMGMVTATDTVMVSLMRGVWGMSTPGIETIVRRGIYISSNHQNADFIICDILKNGVNCKICEFLVYIFSIT